MSKKNFFDSKYKSFSPSEHNTHENNLQQKTSCLNNKQFNNKLKIQRNIQKSNNNNSINSSDLVIGKLKTLKDPDNKEYRDSNKNNKHPYQSVKYNHSFLYKNNSSSEDSSGINNSLIDKSSLDSNEGICKDNINSSKYLSDNKLKHTDCTNHITNYNKRKENLSFPCYKTKSNMNNKDDFSYFNIQLTIINEVKDTNENESENRASISTKYNSASFDNEYYDFYSNSKVFNSDLKNKQCEFIFQIDNNSNNKPTLKSSYYNNNNNNNDNNVYNSVIDQYYNYNVDFKLNLEYIIKSNNNNNNNKTSNTVYNTNNNNSSNAYALGYRKKELFVEKKLNQSTLSDIQENKLNYVDLFSIINDNKNNDQYVKFNNNMFTNNTPITFKQAFIRKSKLLMDDYIKSTVLIGDYIIVFQSIPYRNKEERRHIDDYDVNDDDIDESNYVGIDSNSKKSSLANTVYGNVFFNDNLSQKSIKRCDEGDMSKNNNNKRYSNSNNDSTNDYTYNSNKKSNNKNFGYMNHIIKMEVFNKAYLYCDSSLFLDKQLEQDYHNYNSNKYNCNANSVINNDKNNHNNSNVKSNDISHIGNKYINMFLKESIKNTVDYNSNHNNHNNNNNSNSQIIYLNNNDFIVNNNNNNNTNNNTNKNNTENATYSTNNINDGCLYNNSEFKACWEESSSFQDSSESQDYYYKSNLTENTNTDNISQTNHYNALMEQEINDYYFNIIQSIYFDSEEFNSLDIKINSYGDVELINYNKNNKSNSKCNSIRNSNNSTNSNVNYTNTTDCEKDSNYFSLIYNSEYNNWEIREYNSNTNFIRNDKLLTKTTPHNISNSNNFVNFNDTNNNNKNSSYLKSGIWSRVDANSKYYFRETMHNNTNKANKKFTFQNSNDNREHTLSTNEISNNMSFINKEDSIFSIYVNFPLISKLIKFENFMI